MFMTRFRLCIFGRNILEIIASSVHHIERHMILVYYITGDDLALSIYTQKCLRINENNLFSNDSKIIWR